MNMHAAMLNTLLIVAVSLQLLPTAGTSDDAGTTRLIWPFGGGTLNSNLIWVQSKYYPVHLDKAQKRPQCA